MKKTIAVFFVLATFSFLLTSCGRYTSKYGYRWGDDGLIYNSNNDKLFTGTVLDTADVIIKFQVVNGRKNGVFTTYYLDGQIEKSGYVVNNENIGDWKYYYPEGQLESEGSFESNVPEGKWISYYPNGNKKCEGIYKNGKQQGIWIYYNKTGKIIYNVIFQDGEFIDLQDRIS
jgi:antitoxin component YwqK of YwqJK toxin-antitoxin module